LQRRDYSRLPISLHATTFTRKLKFDQFIGATGGVFSVLGAAGFNTTFPSVKTEGRFNLGYDSDSLSANAFVNYLGKYTNWGGNVANPIVRINASPIGRVIPVGLRTKF
jgi:iron complex outermembrane recepter protein